MSRLDAATLTIALLAAVALGAAHGSAGQGNVRPAAVGITALRIAPLSPAPGAPVRRAVAASAAWCGDATATDRVPQLVAGPSVHLIYAYPSDGPDRFGQFASTMQTDAEAIDAWWRTQDATRTPRFDTFAFACGSQLDISDVELDFGGDDLAPVERRFQLIVGALEPLGFESDQEVYLVYYDGPDDGSGVCGEGGTDDPASGHAFAIVFPSGCPSEPTAVVATHELTHALGAVKSPFPHECPPPNNGHVCDSTRDLMYPFVDGSPLSAYALDVGRDDYYGAVGIGFDVRTSQVLRHFDEPPAHLAVSITGAGTVDSDVPGVACTASCSSDWDGGLSPTLSATPARAMRFVRWGGACSGTADCTPTLAGRTAVRRSSPRRPTVSRSAYAVAAVSSPRLRRRSASASAGYR